MRYIDNGNGAGAWVHSNEAAEYYTNVIHRDHPGMPVNISEEIENLEVLAHHQYDDENGLFTEMIVAAYICDDGHDHVGAFLMGAQLEGDTTRESALKWFELAKEADPKHPNYPRYKADNEFLTALQDIIPGADLSSIVDQMIAERG